MPSIMRQGREPLVPEPHPPAIRARADAIAAGLAVLTQDELRLLSGSVYWHVCRGVLHPRDVAVLRPVLTALARLIDDPPIREGEDLRAGRHPGTPERLRRERRRGAPDERPADDPIPASGSLPDGGERGTARVRDDGDALLRSRARGPRRLRDDDEPVCP